MLTSIDNKLILFSKEINATITKNETKGMWLPKKFEERSLTWTKGDLRYIIQIFPTVENDRILKWLLWACCSSDQNQKRYWKKKVFIETRNHKKIIADLDNLLQQLYSFLATLTFEDLEFAGELRPL